MATCSSTIRSLESSSISPGSQASFIFAGSGTPPSSLLESEGIDEDIFVRPVHPQFFCVHCKKVLRCPMQSGCGCRSCYGCLQRDIKQQGEDLQCSNCKEHFSREEIARDNFARKQLEKMGVHCANWARGCTEQMQLASLDHHLQEDCQYELVHCMHRTKGCQARVQRNQLVQHVEKECLYRRQQCQYCGNNFLLSDMKLHKKECKKLVTKCPNDCGVAVHKDKLGEHIDTVCTLQVLYCLFRNYGCDFKELRKDGHMDVHMHDQQIFHLKCIAEHISSMDKELEVLLQLKSSMEEKLTAAIIGGHTVTAAASMADAETLRQLPAKNERRIRDLQKMILPKLSKIDMLEESLVKAVKQETLSKAEESLKTKQGHLESRLATVEKQLKTGLAETAQGKTMGAAALGLMSSSALENQIGINTVRIAEHDLRFQVLETASHDGILLWKIRDFTRRKRDANSGKTLSLYSQPFYTSRYGYKMCARIYLNGDGMGKDTHVSLFFVLMRGDYDALLTWPFNQKVTMMLLDQETGNRHLTDSFRPDPASSSFMRPTGDMNIASGCPLFVSQSVLDDPVYIKDNVMFIKISVDTLNLVKP